MHLLIRFRRKKENVLKKMNMKTIKFLLSFLLLLVSANFVLGQVQFGGTAGIGFATQSELGSIYNDDDLYTGFNAGFIVRKPINDWFAIKTNLLYSHKGKSFENIEDYKNLEQTYKFSYLEIPIKAEFSAPLNNQRLFCAIGPYAGFLLNAKKKINNTSSSIKEQSEDTDFGISMEIGIIKPIEKLDIQISVNYDMGLSEITKYDNELKNKSLTLNFGLLF